MLRTKIKFLLFIFLPLLSFSQNDTLVFTPHWLPQAQFAGYYMAEKMGFYEQEGLHVSIEHPSASVMATEKLKSGEADVISLFLVTALNASDNGLDMVNICQLSQKCGLLFVTKKASGIETITDLEGKKIGIWESGFDEVPKSAVRDNNTNVEWVPILSTINLFLIGGIDAMTVMWYNEYDAIINAGINEDELNTIFLADYGYNIPEDGIYCLRETIENNNEDLEKFVRGTLRGWEYARQHRKETVDTVMSLMKAAHVPTNRAHQSWMLDRVLELFSSDEGVKSGHLTVESFEQTQELLLNGRYIRREIPYTEFYIPLINK